jgi:hypothetical protein
MCASGTILGICYASLCPLLTARHTVERPSQSYGTKTYPDWKRFYLEEKSAALVPTFGCTKVVSHDNKESSEQANKESSRHAGNGSFEHAQQEVI